MNLSLLVVLHHSKKVYSYEPVPKSLSPQEAFHILGAQGNVWTEYMETPEYVEYMILPRMAALSEVNWSSNKDWNYFKENTETTFLFIIVWVIIIVIIPSKEKKILNFNRQIKIVYHE